MNMTDDGGFTALKMAISKGLDQCVDWLIKAGADVNIAGSAGDTTLTFTLKAGATECVKLLIAAGVDKWGHGLTCELIEQNRGGEKTLKTVKLLLYAGASANIGPGNALTNCLIYQTTGKVREVAQFLFAAGEKLKTNEVSVPDYLKPNKEMSLKHLCRESIREHLLQMSKVNLLVLVPQLGLPSKMVLYILYGIKAASLEKV